ncbi:hypothetical protein PuT2_04570 [Pusillimonas sp. T2]|uniref:DUF5368 family protein n=1 Tax=Pusillimonas sp. T2 TaxID=1548123 RepID=UPI000B9C819A|nr:DUF5368 family protein [Pusillimonas sp. T2]OXR50046.1 hypothetical protein PuT2_04570 [Pusillimonas sp. T2]
MSDFNPLSLFYIVSEIFSVWFWPLLIITLLLLWGVVSSFKKLRRRGLSAGGALFAGLLAGFIATVLATWLLPYSSHADLSAFTAFVDFLAVLAMALVAGLGAFALVFTVMARRRIASARS